METTIDPRVIQQAAEQLRGAATSGTPVAPVRDLISAGGVDAAYAVQEVNTRHYVDSGRRLVGRKIGLTSLAVQRQLGVDQPDYGVLFDDMLVEDGGKLAASRLIQPKAEAEVALVLRDAITMANPTRADVAAATECAIAAIEVVDSRIADWKITFADTVADNGSSAFFVLGQDRRPLDGLDLYTCGMAMEINGTVASLGAGAACLGHPLEAAAWLARVMVDNGTPLGAGDIVMTGALGPMVALQPGDHVEAKIGGLGSVSFTLRK